MTVEDDRAVEYRRSLERRRQARQQRERALAGSPSAHRTLLENWAPWLCEPTPAIEDGDGS